MNPAESRATNGSRPIPTRRSEPFLLAITMLACVFLPACGSGSPDSGVKMPVRKVAFAFDEEITEAEVRYQNPGRPIAKAGFETVVKKSRGQLFRGGELPAMVMPPPGEIAFRVDVPSNAELSFAAGISRKHHKYGPVRFEVEIEGKSIFDRTLDPIRVPEDVDWAPHEESLDAFAGKLIEIVFRTTAIGTGATPPEPIECGFGIPTIATTEQRARTTADRDHPNLLYIVVDTVRADHLSAYGYERATSPNLDRFAAEGIRYETPVSAAPWTWPATASLLTGLYPFTHGVTYHDSCYLPSSADTLAEVLQAEGVTTFGLSANPLVCIPQNFHQGFEYFEEAFQERADVITDRFLAWLDGRGEQRFFAYLHYFDPHYPYDPPDGLRYVEEVLGRPVPADESPTYQAMRSMPKGKGVTGYLEHADKAAIITALYDAEIRYWDEQLGRLRATLEERGILENTIVVVTSDHGEEMFDHGRVGHSLTLHDELTVVPLVIWYPPRLESRLVRSVVETASLPGRLAVMMGADVPDSGKRASEIAPLLRLSDAEPTGSPASTEPTSCTLEPHAYSTTERWTDPEVAMQRQQISVRTAGWKLIYVPEFDGNEDIERPYRLFNLREDPDEMVDVAADHPDHAGSLLDCLLSWQARTLSATLKTWTSAMDDATRKRLQNAGYLPKDGGASPDQRDGNRRTETGLEGAFRELAVDESMLRRIKDDLTARGILDDQLEKVLDSMRRVMHIKQTQHDRFELSSRMREYFVERLQLSSDQIDTIVAITERTLREIRDLTGKTPDGESKGD